MQALQAVPALVSAEISSIDLVSPDKIAIFMVDAFTWWQEHMTSSVNSSAEVISLSEVIKGMYGFY
jgi:hypothetical protein